MSQMFLTNWQIVILSGSWVVVGIVAAHYAFLLPGWEMSRSAAYAVGSIVWVTPVVSAMALAGEWEWAAFTLSMLAIAGVTTLILKYLDKRIPRFSLMRPEPLTREDLENANNGRSH